MILTDDLNQVRQQLKGAISQLNYEKNASKIYESRIRELSLENEDLRNELFGE